jgi:flavin reductase (DIM6/NTAB) family NADH-FMN oxidoreductase RutF
MFVGLPPEEEEFLMALDPMLQRQVMGRFATGVTVVTTRFGDEVSGMTANAVISLSLEPPLVAVSVDKEASMHGYIQEGKCFAINILRLDQEELSNRFAQRGPKDFSDLNVQIAETGAPILSEALAWLDCRLVNTVAAGDHDLILGEPVAGVAAEGTPLLYYGGKYDELVSAQVREDRK